MIEVEIEIERDNIPSEPVEINVDKINDSIENRAPQEHPSQNIRNNSASINIANPQINSQSD